MEGHEGDQSWVMRERENEEEGGCDERSGGGAMGGGGGGEVGLVGFTLVVAGEDVVEECIEEVVVEKRPSLSPFLFPLSDTPAP